MLMPPHVLYQIPYATWSVRLAMGIVGSLFVLAIFGWWLPPASRFLRNLPATGGGQMTIQVVIGFGNTGGVDFESMYKLFANQLGPRVVRRCSASLRS
jgi:hypothetical protein